MKKIKEWMLIIVLILIIPVVSAEGILTGSLLPSVVNLCGEYPLGVELTATNITNVGPTNLTNVMAALVVPHTSGLSFLTEKQVYLGNITTSSLSSFNPSWRIQCNQNLSGEYVAYVEYKSGGNYISSSQNQANSTIIVHPLMDTTPPSITNHSPSNKIVTSYLTLEAATNEPATCKYSTASKVDYSNMPFFFAVTGKTVHKTFLTDLRDGLHHFYIKCQDAIGNRAVKDYEVELEIDTPPAASISLGVISPLKAGMVEVTITITEDLVSAPILKYYFDDSLEKSIPLAGAGKSWKGYLVISNSDHNKIGSFKFSGIDFTGNTGNLITAGNMFLIDTEAPSAPAALTVRRLNNGKVELNWYHTGEDVHHYNIYRTTTAGSTSLVYKTATEQRFIDSSIDEGKVYYYKVSAGDLAGNEGEKSLEISFSATGQTDGSLLEGYLLVEDGTEQVSGNPLQVEDNINEVNNTALVGNIDNLIASAESVLSEINSARTKLESAAEEEVKLLSINEQLKSKKIELMRIIKDLEGLKTKDLMAMEQGLEENKGKIASLKDEILAEIIPGEGQVFNLELSSGKIAEILQEFLAAEGVNKSEKEKKKYLSAVEKVQEGLEVKVEVVPLTLRYLAGREKEVFLVRKEVTVKNREVGDVVLLESIPKNVAADVKETIFNKSFEVVKADPLLKLVVPGLGPKLGKLQFSYILNNTVPVEDLKEIKTVLLRDWKEFAGEESKAGNMLTGFSVLAIPQDASFYDLALLVGFLLIIALFLYSLLAGRGEYTTRQNIPQQNKKISPAQSKESSPVGRYRKIKNILSLNKSRDPKKGGVFDRCFMKMAGKGPIFNAVYFGRKTNYVPGMAWRKQGNNTTFPYPTFAIKEYGDVGLTSLRDTTFLFLVEEADHCVNEMNFEQASRLYQVILANQETITASRGKVDSNLEKKIIKLYKKLCLLIKMNQLYSCWEKKDYVNLKYLLNDVAYLYNRLLDGASVQEKHFLQGIEHYHKVYSQAFMNKL